MPEQQQFQRSGTNFSPIALVVLRELAPSSSKPLSIWGIVLGALSTSIPVLQLIIGYRYVDQCPLDEQIPRYLIIIGILGIILDVLSCSQKIIGIKVVLKTVQSVPRMILSILTCSIAVLLICLLAWVVGGCYYIFRSWDIVQYDDPDQSDYCHPFVYRFAYWILLLTLIVKILAYFQSSLRLPKTIEKFEKQMRSHRD